MRRTVTIALFGLLSIFSHQAFADPIWTETFDSGVGRFDQTLGPGDSRYVWQAAGNIQGNFIRDGANDRRYTLLEQTLDGHADVFGFSVVVEPEATNVGGHAASSIGFWNSNDDNTANRLGISIGGGTVGTSQWIIFRGAYDDAGDSIGDAMPQFVEFNFGITYFIDVLVDGPSHLASAAIYEGTDNTGTFVGSIEEPLDPGRALSFDSLGMGGPFLGSGQWITATIDNFSFTPEPSTASLLLVILATLRRRRNRRAS
ncbi:MAG TPA: PEP-CTERM sorting domain-containing protein [Phycisphaerae bacterium]|nr:PEP-CTERM sorting domain-containing protein [Phycisphaerae bacterium]